jgi:hypothetical protein
MEKALQELAQLGAQHRRITAEQRDSLSTLRERSVALLERGVDTSAVATAIGVSSIAVAGWHHPQGR